MTVQKDLVHEHDRRGGAGRRDAFMNAALRRFARHGFAATSTRQICADLSIAHSAIYNYFPTKEAILLAIGERDMTAIQAGLDAILDMTRSESAVSRLRHAIRHTLIQAMDRRDSWRLLVDMLPSLAPRNRAIMIAHRDRFEATLRQVTQAAADEGSIAVDDVRMAVFHVLGIADGVGRWYDPKGPLSRDRIAEDTTVFLMRAFRPG
ncbi:MAG: TetR/AcrR family transcriptional regulator [Pseudomonadota bacterium]|nr:TetR/AcrR family transcriptional regulator [Pseudomonadota bacterium]